MDLVTEESAKEKWCPFGRVESNSKSSYNRWRDGQASSGSLCLGHKCMMFLRADTDASGCYYCGLSQGE